MRFHWLNRGIDNSIEGLKKLSEDLDKYGYYSMLLVYHSKLSDNLVKAVRVMSEDQNIKYMLAIRTYSISPEYLAMVCQSVNEIIPNKLLLNIVSGDIHEDETSIDDLVFINELVSTPELRLQYTDKWMEKFLNMKILEKRPEILMAGHSENTRNMCNKYNSTHISMLDMYLAYSNQENKIINNKQCITTSFVTRENIDEASSFAEKNFNQAQKNWTIYGDKDSVKDQIKKLESIGITDILMSSHIDDEKVYLTHEAIREYLEETNGIK